MDAMLRTRGGRSAPSAISAYVASARTTLQPYVERINLPEVTSGSMVLITFKAPVGRVYSSNAVSSMAETR